MGMGRPPHGLFASFSITTGPIPPKLSGESPGMCPQVLLAFGRNPLIIAKVYFCPSPSPWGGLPMIPHGLFASFSITTGPIPPKLSGESPGMCPQVLLAFGRNPVIIAKVDFCPSPSPWGGLPMIPHGLFASSQ